MKLKPKLFGQKKVFEQKETKQKKIRKKLQTAEVNKKTTNNFNVTCTQQKKTILGCGN